MGPSGGPPLDRGIVANPRPLGPRGLLLRPPGISSRVREGERLSAPLPAVFGRLPNESGVLSREGAKFDIDAEGCTLLSLGGRICSLLGARIGCRSGGSEEYMLPGGGVDDDPEGARCEKNDPCVELEVGGLLRGGGSNGICGDASPEGPLGLPGLNGGICGAGPGEPAEGLRACPPPSI